LSRPELTRSADRQKARSDKDTARRNIAKVDASMLSKDATQQWTGQTSAVTSRDVWGNGGIFE
jgi:hypothetical protein